MYSSCMQIKIASARLEQDMACQASHLVMAAEAWTYLALAKLPALEWGCVTESYDMRAQPTPYEAID